LKILFVSAEVAPLAKSGGLGDVAGALPASLREAGLDVRMVMPLYRRIKEKYAQQLSFLRWTMIKLGWRTLYSGLLSMDVGGVPAYFIDNDYYFGYEQLYVDYAFDIERFSFFQRAVLGALGEPMDFEPDIIHCNDWQTGMIPCLLDAHYRDFGLHQKMRTVYTIHNLKFQGVHGREQIADLMDLPERYLTEDAILKNGVPNFMKAGIVFADRVTTVSPSYAREIMTPYYGEGLHEVLQSVSGKVCGLLNGIDVNEYDPSTDSRLAVKYDSTNWLAGKAACKAALQSELGLEPDPGVPLACLVSRLTDQKGIDLLVHALAEILAGSHDGGYRNDALQVAILGTGDAAYEAALAGLADRHAGRLAVRLVFDSDLSHRYYAGADLFLMPSLFEPCGLSQMIALRYGTLPVVRETGGLKDTVFPYDPASGTGNGFTFWAVDAREFTSTILRACDVYRHNPPAWAGLVRTAMQGDYSWQKSATDYVELYESLRG
jgi:starch synthase